MSNSGSGARLFRLPLFGALLGHLAAVNLRLRYGYKALCEVAEAVGVGRWFGFSLHYALSIGVIVSGTKLFPLGS